MNLGNLGHLCYCTNIHPGETWPQVHAQLSRHVPVLKQRLSPDAPFALGLRLSALAAQELSHPDNLTQFKRWLTEHGCYVFTLNGFPYGTFHGQTVKADVYRPDWRQPQRVAYTRQLADILAAVLPADLQGSISTVPGAFKADIGDRSERQAIVDNLIATAAYLHQLAEQSGRQLCLALEPEPGCMLETADDTLAFFRDELFTAASVSKFSQLSGAADASIDLLRRYLGVCLDTCHAAVMFEQPVDTALALIDAGIPIAKLQLTAALAVERMDRATLQALSAFEDPVYLHQTMVDHQGSKTFFVDLPDACAAFAHSADGSRWRCHYHVPVFQHQLGRFHTTSNALAELLQQHALTPLSTHLEVETYTFDLLPEQYRLDQVTDNISRELCWIKAQLKS